MNPVNSTSSLTNVAEQAQTDRHLGTDSTDWLSQSKAWAGQSISAVPLFDAGTTINEISSQILSCICEPGNS